MADTVVITRKHIIYGVVIPLAALLGFLLSEPFDYGTMIFIGLLTMVFITPVFIRWNHPLLIFSCYAVIYPYFIPGRPMLWMIMASVSFFFLVLNRSMGRRVEFFRAKPLSWAMIILFIVIVLTAIGAGNFGFASLGSHNAGSKRYFYLFCSIALYFGLSCTTIDKKYRKIAIAAFFLSALTTLVGYLAAYGGSGFYFLIEFFPIETNIDEAMSIQAGDMGIANISRLGNVGVAGVAVFCYLMARYGVRGLLDSSKPWRLVFLLLTAVAALYSGFRANLILIGMTFAMVFYLEGLFRSHFFPILLLIFVFFGALSIPFTRSLPLPIQRTLSFLPINVDPVVQANADDSTNWRLEMWKDVTPTIPKYFLKGKGYVMDAGEIYLVEMAKASGYARSYDVALMAGDYHSGPLSVIIPFGIWGVLAFSAVLIIGGKTLYDNYRYGDPALITINRLLFALYIVRIFFFLFIFGSLFSDFFYFASLVGFGVSLNGGVGKAPVPAQQAAVKIIGLKRQVVANSAR